MIQLVRLMKIFCFTCLFSLGYGSFAQAGSLLISPVILSLNAKTPVGVITLKNEGQSVMMLEVKSKFWTQHNGQQQLVEDPTLVVTPTTLVLKPGESRRLRTGFLTAGIVPAEQAYRLEIAEISPEVPDRAVRMRLQFSVPVFYGNPPQKTAAIAGLSATLQRERNNRLMLKTSNPGQRHLRLVALRLNDGNGTVIPLAQGLQSYLLAGSELRQWISAAGVKQHVTLLYTEPDIPTILEQDLTVGNEVQRFAND